PYPRCHGNAAEQTVSCMSSSRVIEEELQDLPSEDVHSLMLQVDPVLTEDERTKLAKMLHAIGEELDNNKELQALINSSDLMPARDHFMWVVNEVFEHGITWTRIVVLFYFAGRMAVKANLPQSVRDLRRWIRRHGGWVCLIDHTPHFRLTLYQFMFFLKKQETQSPDSFLNKWIY
uniref:Bcl-2 Bcl-2 homology region 1-3 domain-containing protein n=1 Tax=Salarias fasciatus TaxID=181472 RepID=A0A672HN02_SALFA